MYATPGLQASQIPDYFKDSSFGVPDGQAERTYSPRGDVTIVRDRGFGVPHIYGANRDGAMFGTRLRRRRGPAVLHGRAAPRRPRPSCRASRAARTPRWTPSSGRSRPTPRPTSSARRRSCPGFLGADGKQIQRDVDQLHRRHQRLHRRDAARPVEAAGRVRRDRPPRGPAAVEGGRPDRDRARWSAASSARAAARSWLDRRSPTRCRSASASARACARSATSAPPRTPRRRPPCAASASPTSARRSGRAAAARPDRGSLKLHEVVAARSGGSARARARRAGLSRGLAAVHGVQRRARLRPRVGQPAPADGRRPAGRLLQPADPDGAGRARARGRRRAGDRRARRVVHRRQPLRPARPRARLRLERDLGGPGHHRHVRGAALRAGRRQADATMHYPYRGSCLPIEVLEAQELLAALAGTTRPPGTQTLRAERTKLGLVAGAARCAGKPVIFTKLRSTYFHEVDSAAGFKDFNDPIRARRATSSAPRARSATRSTGSTPTPSRSPTSTRARTRCAPSASTTPSRCARASTSGGAGTRTATRRRSPRSPSTRRRSTSSTWSPGTTSRRAASRAGRERVLLRLPLAAARGPARAPSCAAGASSRCRGGRHHGGGRHRRPARARGAAAGAADHRRARRTRGCAQAVDRCALAARRRAARSTATATASTSTPTRSGSWTPGGRGGCARSSSRARRKAAFDRLLATVELDNTPNNHGDHLGSAYQGAWYGYVRKDLRTVLGRKVAAATRALLRRRQLKRAAPCCGARCAPR